MSDGKGGWGPLLFVGGIIVAVICLKHDKHPTASAPPPVVHVTVPAPVIAHPVITHPVTHTLVNWPFVVVCIVVGAVILGVVSMRRSG